MSDSSNPPQGPDSREPQDGRPADGAGPAAPADRGQSQVWWTKPAEPQQEYLKPTKPSPNAPTRSWPTPPPPPQSPYSTPGAGQAPYASPSAGQPPYANPGSGQPYANPGSGQTPYGPSSGQPPYGPGSGQAPHGGPGQGGNVPPGWQYPPATGQGQYPPLMAQIPIPQPPGPGRRRASRGLPKMLLVLVAAVAVLVAGTGVTMALRSGDDDPTPVAVDPPSATPSITPSPTPTPTPSPTPTPKVTPKPKPKPKPKPPTAQQLVARNKLYSSGLVQPAKCKEPPLRPTTYAATNVYYHRLLPCLNRSWSRSLKKAGIKFRAPKVVVYAGTIKTPCGVERSTRGYYCGGNQTIYMPFAVDYRNYKINPMYTRAWMLNTFAHEYGHHVQALTGIFGASFVRQAGMKSPDSRLLESRRRELQASCLGSAYLSADKASLPLKGDLLAAWRFAVANAGDEFAKPKIRDHGSKKNHNLWSLRGFNSRNPGLCNTWTVPAKYLS